MSLDRPSDRQRNIDKVARIPVKVPKTERNKRLRKPAWIRAPFPGTPEVAKLKKVLRKHELHTVCEEANCPNLGECFGNGTATFMIMGDLCTRRCPFCDVAHGRPRPLDANEPAAIAQSVKLMKLNYVVITSVIEMTYEMGVRATSRPVLTCYGKIPLISGLRFWFPTFAAEIN